MDYSSVSEFKEFNAFATFIHKAGAKRKKSPLIAELLEDTIEVNVQVFLDHCQHVAASLSGDKPIEIALNHARDIGILVDERLPKKVAATYKGFVMEVAVVCRPCPQREPTAVCQFDQQGRGLSYSPVRAGDPCLSSIRLLHKTVWAIRPPHVYPYYQNWCRAYLRQ